MTNEFLQNDKLLCTRCNKGIESELIFFFFFFFFFLDRLNSNNVNSFEKSTAT